MMMRELRVLVAMNAMIVMRCRRYAVAERPARERQIFQQMVHTMRRRGGQKSEKYADRGDRVDGAQYRCEGSHV
jgi:hypothetical protein